MAQGCLPPDVVAYVRYNYIIGAGRFRVVVSGGGCGGVGDRDSKLT